MPIYHCQEIVGNTVKKIHLNREKEKVKEAENRETKLGRSPSFRLLNFLHSQLKSNDTYVFTQV